MRYLTTALLLAMTSVGWTAQDDDKIGKLSAPAALQKALKLAASKKIVKISEKSELAIGQQKYETQFDGVLKKDFAGVKGSQEVYAKADKYLVKVGARFDPPDKVQEQEGVEASSFKNPALIMKELAVGLRSAQFTADEEVDGDPCALVVIQCDPRLVRVHTKETSDRIMGIFAARRPGGAGDFLRSFAGGELLDPKESASTFAVWIARKDLLIRRIEWIMEPAVKKNSVFARRFADAKIATRITVLFSNWDGDVPFDIPTVIQKKFRVR